MKVLLTHRYYAPDTPAYANMLRTIAEGLAEKTELALVWAAPANNKKARPISSLCINRSMVRVLVGRQD